MFNRIVLSLFLAILSFPLLAQEPAAKNVPIAALGEGKAREAVLRLYLKTLDATERNPVLRERVEKAVDEKLGDLRNTARGKAELGGNLGNSGLWLGLLAVFWGAAASNPDISARSGGYGFVPPLLLSSASGSSYSSMFALESNNKEFQKQADEIGSAKNLEKALRDERVNFRAAIQPLSKALGWDAAKESKFIEAVRATWVATLTVHAPTITPDWADPHRRRGTGRQDDVHSIPFDFLVGRGHVSTKGRHVEGAIDLIDVIDKNGLATPQQIAGIRAMARAEESARRLRVDAAVAQSKFQDGRPILNQNELAVQAKQGSARLSGNIRWLTEIRDLLRTIVRNEEIRQDSRATDEINRLIEDFERSLSEIHRLENLSRRLN